MQNILTEELEKYLYDMVSYGIEGVKKAGFKYFLYFNEEPYQED